MENAIADPMANAVAVQMEIRHAAVEIVNGSWSAVEEISKELIKNGRISGDNVEQIVSRQKGEES
jgi:hypothetical protein